MARDKVDSCAKKWTRCAQVVVFSGNRTRGGGGHVLHPQISGHAAVGVHAFQQ